MNVEQLTISAVTNPTSIKFGDGVLATALKEQAEKANANYVSFAKFILERVQRERACLTQEKLALEAKIKTLTEREEKINKGIDAADDPNKGLFPLAAILGLKEDAIYFAKENGVVVPSNTDPVWSLEEKKVD